MKKGRFRNVIVYLCLISMIMTLLPPGPWEGHAASTRQVTIRNTYVSFQRTQKIVTIRDDQMKNFTDKKLYAIDSATGLNSVKIEHDLVDMVEAILNTQWDISSIRLQGTIKDAQPSTQILDYAEINEDDIPEITSVETPMVGLDVPIIAKGSNNLINLVDNASQYSIRVGSVNAKAVPIHENGQRLTNKVQIVPLTDTSKFLQGKQDIVVTRKATLGEGANQYVLENIFSYKEAVVVVGSIDLEGMTMFPTMGEPGSEIQFKRENLQKYDVYFINDLNNPDLFNENNRVKDSDFKLVNNPSPQNDIITVKVPNVASGPYYVVFTNAESQKYGVQRRYVFPNQQYTVIQITQQPSIVSVQENYAPSLTATPVKISGYFFAEHNLPGFTPDQPLKTQNFTINQEGTTGTLNFGTGKLKIGNKEYRVKVTRDFQIQIGQMLRINKFEFDPTSSLILNRFDVTTPVFQTDQTENHDVIIHMETKIRPADDLQGGETFQSDVVKDVVLPKGFTYLPPTEKPNVSQVLPQVIPIEDINGKTYIHSSVDELVISITGQKFLVTRYRDAQGQERVNYPKVSLGGVIINPNHNRASTDYNPLSYDVLNGGVTVRGVTGNEIGDTIMIRVKTGSGGIQIKEKNMRNITVTNPLRNSISYSDEYAFSEKVEFKYIGVNEFPVIERVNPSIVAVSGGQDVTITGRELRKGAKVYINNKLVPNIVTSGDKTTITFKAPPSLPGVAQLRVENPEGGIATHPFTYTVTYTEPKLISIHPNEGMANTIVTMKGENFLPVDPSVVVESIDQIDELLIYRLIGSRVLMGGHDINSYNRSGNRITLTKYVQGFQGRNLRENIFKYDSKTKELEIGKNFDSAVFYDAAEKKFYVIRRNIKDEYTLESSSTLSDGKVVENVYNISYQQDQGKFVAQKNGIVYDMVFPQKGEMRLQRDGQTHITLSAYTPYLIEEVSQEGTIYHDITGKRVEFIDNQTLLFTVPVLSLYPWIGNGAYDVTIVNPDTKSHTLPKGFQYKTPVVIPKVENIFPNQGPEKGGNIITITSADDGDEQTGFMDLGTEKTKVYIGSKQVDPKDISIAPNGRELTLRVPATLENIADKFTDRITLPVVLVNPDGGTFSITYNRPIVYNDKVIRGYTYVVPTSMPKLITVTPTKGSASGGYIVEILGSDFRNFEPFTDLNGNGKWESGEVFTDLDGNGAYTPVAPKTKETSRYNQEYQYLNSVLLPKVYFGNQQAHILDYSSGYLQVIVPPGKGVADVYVENNDAGISNSLKFTYELSKPTIRSITPDVGTRLGGDKVEIQGEDFRRGLITLLKNTYEEPSGLSSKEVKSMATLKIGERTNKNLPREHENAGVIRASHTTVRLDGGITVRYNGSDNGALLVEIQQNDKRYNHTYYWNGEEPVFIDTRDLKEANGSALYPQQELIRFEILSNRLLVEGGYAPEVEYINDKLVRMTTPAYHGVGKVPLSIVNPDGGIGTKDFTYKNPDSKPKITRITRDGREAVLDTENNKRILKVTYKGGSILTIVGEDFRENAKVSISDMAIPTNAIKYELPTKISFTLPPVPKTEIGKLHRVVVVNEDGASTHSELLNPPLYIEFIEGESSPQVNKLTPNQGPATGGTRVKIEGVDFRQSMEGHDGKKLRVYFGEMLVPESDVEYVDHKTLWVKAPANNQEGNVSVKIENPDGELSNPPGSFQYISKPTIETINPPRIFANDTNTEVTIGGRMFMSGAKVIIGGKIVPKAEVKAGTKVTAEGISGVDASGKNVEVAVVGGVEAASVTWENQNTLKVKFKEVLDLENHHLIIVNPDKGISVPYESFQYRTPVPTRPLVLEAIPGFESTVQLLWSDTEASVLNRADRYEVYGKLATDKQYAFLGDTRDTKFLVKGLKPNTEYQFMVRAMNRYGSALEFAEVKVRTLTLQEDAKLKEKLKQQEKEKQKLDTEGKEETVQGAIIKTIGRSQIPKGTSPYVLDFSVSKYKDYKKYTVALPVDMLGNVDRSITLTDGKLKFTFKPGDLITREAATVASTDLKDAHMRVSITKLTGQEEQGIKSTLGKNERVASSSYQLSFDLQVAKDIKAIEQLSGNGTLEISFDSRAYPLANKDKLYIGRYNPEQDKLIKTKETSGNRVDLRRSGKYLLFSER